MGGPNPFDGQTIDDTNIIVNLMDYNNHSVLLCSCTPDVVLYNVANSVKRQSEEVAPHNIPSNAITESHEDDTQDESTPIADKPDNIPEPFVEPEPEMEPMIVKVNAKAIERALLAEIPKSYQSDSMFFTNVFVNDDNSVEFMIQLDQNNDNKDAAFSLAIEFYKKAKQITEDAGGQMGRYDIMVLDNGSPLGDYVTDNGKTYSLIADGKVVRIDAP